MASADGLVGREAEFAVAAAAVRELSEGRASALAIEGEAGIGKTRLVQSLVDDARARGVTVVLRRRLIRSSAPGRSVWLPPRWT